MGHGSFMGTNIHLEKSSVANVVMVDTAGKVTGKAVGTATVTATYSGNSVTVPVNVRKPDVEEITITSKDTIIRRGGTEQLAVIAYLSDETIETVTVLADYISSNPSAATVSNTGLVTGVAEGATTITARYDNMSATINIEVRPRLYIYIRTLL